MSNKVFARDPGKKVFFENQWVSAESLAETFQRKLSNAARDYDQASMEHRRDKNSHSFTALGDAVNKLASIEEEIDMLGLVIIPENAQLVEVPSASAVTEDLFSS